MKKRTAIGFYGNQILTAKALGISCAAISQWPEKLTLRQQDEVIGAAIRLNKLPPDQAKELITNERQGNERSARDAH